MKKTISFNLEEDIIAKIENYQKKNNLSSRSAALERIILAMNNSTIDTDRILNLITNLKDSINVKESSIKEPIKTELDKAITNCFDEMPE